MFFSLPNILEWLLRYKYTFLFPVAMIEGPIISIMAGFLIANGVLNLPATYAILILGDLVGDSIYYAIGKWGGRPFIRRWGYIFGLTEEKLLSAQKRYEHHGRKALIVGKTQPWGSVVLAIAGITQMPFRNFLWINFLSSTVKSAVLLVIGYYIGQSYMRISGYINYFGAAMIAVTVLLIVGLWLWKKFRS